MEQAHGPPTLTELLNEKWILYPPDQVPGALVRRAFRDHGLELPRARVYTRSHHLRDMLLATGSYLTVVPACMLSVLNAKRRTVRQLPIDLGIQARPVAIFTLKNRTLSPLAKLFIGCARAAGARFAAHETPSPRTFPSPKHR
jgi:DNA-binding transcriptional LysR family regulator